MIERVRRAEGERYDGRPEAERLLLVARRVEDGRFLFARWADWPHPALISTLPPGAAEGFDAGLETLLRGRFGVRPAGSVRRSERRLPVRMAHPAGGGEALGWLRPVAVEVAGEPRPAGPIEAVDALTLEEGLAALTTDVERAGFRLGASLFNDGPFN
jgi:hypothetical protein